MDSDEETHTQTWKGATGTIILINLYDPENHQTATQAHSATCKIVKQCLRSGSSQNLGVCYYGVEDDSSSLLDAKGVLDVFPINLPSLKDYVNLRDKDISAITKSNELNMSDVLWHCSKMFANFKKQLSTKTVIILAGLDMPPAAADQRPTLKRVDDLVDSNVDIKFVNISQNKVEIHEFYKDFLTKVNRGKEYELPKPVWETKDIENMLYQESQRHLAVAQLLFQIAEDFSIGVGVYNLIKSPQSFHKTVNLDSESNTLLTSVTETTKRTIENNSEANGGTEAKHVPLLKSEILHVVEYGGERINFTDKEFMEIKNPFGPPMLKLLGFKPAIVLSKEKWFLRMCNFLYPNESLVEGSTVAFKALHKACTEMSVVAICVLTTRINAHSKIVALSPCTNSIGLDVKIGFNVIQIPFVENIREVPIPEGNDEIVSEAHKVAMKHVVEKTMFVFKPDMFENPKLQSQYRAIEAVALEDEELLPFVDTTIPHNEALAELDESLFHEIFGSFNSAPKRSASNKQAGNTKKIKEDLNIDVELLKERVENHKVDKFKVADLKNILKSKSIPNLPALTGLNKDKLVDLVYKHFSE